VLRIVLLVLGKVQGELVVSQRELVSELAGVVIVPPPWLLLAKRKGGLSPA